MIESYADKETAKVAAGEVSKKLPRNIQEQARLKLRALNRISKITELWAVPGFKVKRIGEGWSIRINDQWRITFFFNEATAAITQVHIEDYH